MNKTIKLAFLGAASLATSAIVTDHLIYKINQRKREKERQRQHALDIASIEFAGEFVRGLIAKGEYHRSTLPMEDDFMFARIMARNNIF